MLFKPILACITYYLFQVVEIIGGGGGGGGGGAKRYVCHPNIFMEVGATAPPPRINASVIYLPELMLTCFIFEQNDF